MIVAAEPQTLRFFGRGDVDLLRRTGKATIKALARAYFGWRGRDELGNLGVRMEEDSHPGREQPFSEEDLSLLVLTEKSLRLREPLEEKAAPFERSDYAFRKRAADACARCAAVIRARMLTPREVAD